MENAERNKKSRQIEYITIVLGTIYSALFVNIISEISYRADWQVVLVNQRYYIISLMTIWKKNVIVIEDEINSKKKGIALW